MKSQLYIYPTDTVWGIGAPVQSRSLHERIVQIKKADPYRPFSLFYTSFNELMFDFDLPLDLQRNENWWKSLFSMETTVALPKSILRRNIPDWVVDTSKNEHVAIRLNELKELKPLTVNGPISTTSLNFFGGSPLKTLKEALAFSQVNAPDAQVIQPVQLNPSGFPSTVVSMNSSLEFHIAREGRLLKQVKTHLGLHST